MDTILLTNGGRRTLLDYYFPNNDLWVGLWWNSSYSLPDFDTITLPAWTVPNEITNSDYDRILIDKNNWVLEDDSTTLFLNKVITFAPLVTDWNVLGYFIATTEDNSGRIIMVEKVTTKTITIEQEKYFNIVPKITLY